MRRQRRGWEVRVVNATSHKENDYFYYGSSRERYSSVPVQGTVAVRLFCDGKSAMTYDTVQIKDPEFDDKITTFKAEALEKAATLNAVECGA